MSAALSLVGMLLFAITGITLNHAATIGASPTTVTPATTLSRPLLDQIARTTSDSAPLPPAIAQEIDAKLGLDPAGRAGEWSTDEIYVALPRPGGDAWISIDRRSGVVTAEITDRGWISFANDLHKGRNAGAAWGWFIDIFAGACILFTLTGLFLLYMHARPRPMTWPLVGLGLIVPLLIVILFLH